MMPLDNLLRTDAVPLSIRDDIPRFTPDHSYSTGTSPACVNSTQRYNWIAATAQPAATLAHILRFVKDDGAVFVHSYARTWQQMLRWKYALLPFTRRMNSQKLYRVIKAYAPFAFHLTNALRKIPGGRYITHFFIPFLNYRHVPKFAPMSDEAMVTYGVHDTFDALSPRYDTPIAAAQMKEIAAPMLHKPFEIIRRPMVTLLRSVIKPAG